MTHEEHCRAYEAGFPEKWQALTAAFNAEGEDAFWQIRHASYLFRTQGVRWCVDPTLRTDALMDYTEGRAGKDLQKLSFVLTSHFHSDHFNARFCRQLDMPDTIWIVPDFANKEQRDLICDCHSHVVFVHAGDKLTINGMEISVLPGHHFDDGGTTGIASYTYSVNTGKWLIYFPGDVRDYRTKPVSDVAAPDLVFAHVWLGRSRALLTENHEFLDPYCRYIAGMNAKRVMLAHLYNFTRPDNEMWGDSHAESVINGLKEIGCASETLIPYLGETNLI